jgi:phosphotransferase system HPr-like phosphotransfer protein
MKSLDIALNSVSKVKAFVNIINTFDGDFDLVSDRYVVDAKSIMGIFSLDISAPIRLDVHNDAEFDKVAEALKDFTE